MRSMTGYAYREVSGDAYSVSVEIKSYNSRFLDLSVNLPSFLSRLEPRIREFASSGILRGKAEIYIRVKELSENVTITANLTAAVKYAEAIKSIAVALGRENEVPLGMIIEREGVLRSDRDSDPEMYWTLITPVLEEAFADFTADREREGLHLKQDILNMTERLESCRQIITGWVPKMEKMFRDAILERFHELLGNGVDEQRVMQETAAQLVKYTINEELVRLGSHLESLRKELTENSAPGRKIDFICQEINREINTIGSKNQIVEVGRAVIEAKDALENIREQARNIE